MGGGGILRMWWIIPWVWTMHTSGKGHGRSSTWKKKWKPFPKSQWLETKQLFLPDTLQKKSRQCSPCKRHYSMPISLFFYDNVVYQIIPKSWSLTVKYFLFICEFAEFLGLAALGWACVGSIAWVFSFCNSSISRLSHADRRSTRMQTPAARA